MEKDIYRNPESELQQPEEIEVESQEDSQDQKLKGLGGWLILVGIGVVVGPVRLIMQTVPLYYPLFTDGSFGVLIDPESDYYIPYIGAFIIAEVLLNAVIILASLYLIYLFFSKHYLFPRFYIVVIAGSALFIFVDAWVGTFFFPDEPLMDQEIAGEFGRALISAMIWIPYMLVSKRVKLTFVEHGPR